MTKTTRTRKAARRRTTRKPRQPKQPLLDMTVKLDEPVTVGAILREAEDNRPKVVRVPAFAQWPATWWQHLKDRFFPALLLDFWPVEYDRVDYTVEVDGTPVPTVTRGLVARLPDDKSPGTSVTLWSSEPGVYQSVTVGQPESAVRAGTGR